MVILRKFLFVIICIFAIPAVVCANDTQTVTISVEIPQVNWIRIEDQGVSIQSYVGYSSKGQEFSYSVSATGRRPRVITARLEKPVPKGCRIILEMDPLEVGEPAGPTILSPQETVVMKNIWGIFNQKGTGKIKIETDMDASQGTGNMNITFAVKEGL